MPYLRFTFAIEVLLFYFTAHKLTPKQRASSLRSDADRSPPSPLTLAPEEHPLYCPANKNTCRSSALIYIPLLSFHFFPNLRNRGLREAIVRRELLPCPSDPPSDPMPTQTESRSMKTLHENQSINRLANALSGCAPLIATWISLPRTLRGRVGFICFMHRGIG